MFPRFIVCAALCLCGAATVRAGDEALPSADEVIAKYIEVIGGRDALDSIKTLHMTGKMVFGGGMEAPMTLDLKRPGKVRLEFTIQGMTGTQAFDGETGWFVMPFAGKPDPEKMPPDMLKDFKQQADLDGPLVDYKKKGHKVEMVGLDEFEGTPVYKLKVTRADGDVEYHLLDKELFILLATKGTRDFQGTPIEYELALGDYKEVNGLLVPHSIVQKGGGGPGGMTISFDKIEANMDIPDSRFAMPEEKSEKPDSDKQGD